MKKRYPAAVYRALAREGYSNREIARMLDVNESTVRRAAGKVAPRTRTFTVTVTEVE